ncbi:N-acetyltransferase [Actinoplanes sp. DH11]|uniref:GNAT family N-acetyltransferase n=1 Tax=Actinoplanes sp. DH11 TaxID=2857011 RepID=UPI001E3CFC61|nr:GNAT family N-acetyltransferase [Actinoplanes sp. DH11]
MTSAEISLATPAHRNRIVESLVAAFPADPVLRYLFPDDATYPRHAAAFFGHLFDKRVHRNAIWTIGDGAAVAIWEPPAEPGAAAPAGELELPEAERSRMKAYDVALHAVLPQEPYWYLGVLGTHPDWTGRRWGHTLMAAGLRRAAEDRLPAVLETSTEGNVRMYEKAGWQVTASFRDPLPVWVLRHDA